MFSKELGLFTGLAAMYPPSPPRRRLVAARRLGRFAGLAAMFPPSPPSRLVVASRLDLGVGLAAM